MHVMRIQATSILLSLVLLVTPSCRKEMTAHRQNPVRDGDDPVQVVLSSSTVIAYPEESGVHTMTPFKVQPSSPDAFVHISAGGNAIPLSEFDASTGVGRFGAYWDVRNEASMATMDLTATTSTGSASARITVFKAVAEFLSDEFVLPSSGGTEEVPLNANVPVKFALQGNPGWLSITGSSDGKVVLTVKENASKADRTVRLSVTDTTGFLRSETTLRQPKPEAPDPGTTPVTPDPPGPVTPDPKPDPVMEYVRSSFVSLHAADGSSLSSKTLYTGEIYFISPSYSGEGKPKSYEMRVVDSDAASIVGENRIAISGSGKFQVRVEARMSDTLTYYNEVDLSAVCKVTTAFLCRYLNESGAKEWSNTGVYFRCETAAETTVTMTGKVTAKSVFGTWTTDISGISGKSCYGSQEFLVLKYTDLEGFVKKHLLASFSIEITITSPTRDRELYFEPSDSMRKLVESTGKDIPVKVNGKSVDWNKKIKL